MNSLQKESILVVDDVPDALELLRRNLAAEAYTVYAATAAADAIKVLESTHVDLVITDLKMPGGSGLDLIRHVRENLKDTEVMMVTGYPSIESAVSAVKLGAEEYIAKPFTDAELLTAVRRALEKLHLRKLARTAPPAALPASHGLSGESQAMLKIFEDISKAAATSANVLLTGESGTGKELVARAIHYSSPRAAAPFVPVNCGGIPEGLIESELFGHMKGAFTGATESRAGFFQTADGGTIFLDEVSDTSLSMQAKLLRVLQDKEVCMVGATRTRKIDIRVLAATNKDLSVRVKKELFREDLFFRLNVITIFVPPLRERENDILLLIRHFAQRFASELGREQVAFSDNALQVLKNYYWPGNVRELENVVHRMVAMTDGNMIDVPDLPSLLRFSGLRKAGMHRTLAEVETEHIQNVLAGVDNNKTRAAEILGIDRKTLREKLKALEVTK